MATNEKRQPLVRVSKRPAVTGKQSLLLSLGAVGAALAIGAVIIACMRVNPILYYWEILRGSFGGGIKLKMLVNTWVPLLMISLGLCVAFRMKFWNIGAEGQFIMGGICACAVGLGLGDSLPHVLGVSLVLLAGIAGGGLYGLLAAFFKVRFGTNETLLTLMLNYVALYLLEYFFYNADFFASITQFPTFRAIHETLHLSVFTIGRFEFDTGLLAAIVLAVVLTLYFSRTKQGYEIRVLGDSLNTARYAGMRVNRVILRTAFLSAAIIGLAGALKLTGIGASQKLSTNFTSGMGWTAIIVAWLAKQKPPFIVIVSFLMSVLIRGSAAANSLMDVSAYAADVIQGIILFSVLAFDFFTQYKLHIRRKKKIPPADDPAPAEGEAA